MKGKHGAVTVRNLLNGEEFTIQSSMIRNEESFLDLSEDDGIIYVTTTQDENGFSRIYQVDLEARSLKWFDTIKDMDGEWPIRKRISFAQACMNVNLSSRTKFQQ